MSEWGGKKGQSIQAERAEEVKCKAESKMLQDLKKAGTLCGRATGSKRMENMDGNM